MFRFRLLCVLVVVLVCSTVSAEIQLKKTFFGGWKYSTDGVEYHSVGMSGTGLYNEMSGNEAAQAKMDSYKKNATLSMLTAIPGGFLVGWPLGGYIGSSEWKDGYTTMMMIGVPLSIVSIVTETAAKRNLKEAVSIYNGETTALSLGLKYQPTINGQDNNLLFSVSYSF